MTLSQLINKAVTLKHRYEKAEAKAKAARKEYDEARAEILANMNKENLKSSGTTKASVSVIRNETYKIDDYEMLETWTLKNKALDLFQRRLSVTNLRERIEAGERIPGVKKEIVRILRINESSD